MNRPFRVTSAAPGGLPAVPAHQDEIFKAHDFAEPDLIALHPKSCPGIVANGQVPERHIAMAFHLQYPARARRLGELLLRRHIGRAVGHCALQIRCLRQDCRDPNE